MLRRIVCLLALTGALVACGGEEESASTGAESPTAESPTPATPEPEPEPEPSEPTRLVTGERIDPAEDGTFRFRLTSHAEAPIRSMQSWVYYFNAEGECVGRYPHSFIATLAPDGTVEQALGQDGEHQPEGTTQAEVEITRVTFEDRSEWRNENLVETRTERTLGGPSHEELLARTGELITGEWTGEYGEDGRPALTLHNTTDEPLEPRTVWVYYYNAQGGYEGRDVLNLMGTTIAPGADHALTGGDTQDTMDEDMRYIEVVVSRIDRADDTQWENANLSAAFRPMAHPPEASPEASAD